jgi:hypothetical protein
MAVGDKHSWTPGFDYEDDCQWVGIKYATLTVTPPVVTTVTGSLTLTPPDVTTITSVTPYWVYATTSGGDSSLYTYASQTGGWAVGVSGGSLAATQSGVWSVGINTGARVAIASVSGNIGISGLVGATQSGVWTVGIVPGSQIAIASVNGNIGVSGAVAATQSGTWTVGLSGTTFVYATQSVASTIISTDSASNAWATVTLPAAGAGLFHYITAINCNRVWHPGYTNQIATVQTVNLNSWRVLLPPISSITDTTQDVSMSFSPPLRAAAANSTTSIGMLPAGTNVKWSAYAVYYTGA